jgi:hypothetical protein
VPRAVFFRPAHISSRIAGQFGYFTVHPAPFKDLTANERSDEQLVKILIRLRHRAQFRRELDRMGINRASLFPDLDGIARQVKWANCRLADEQDRRAIRVIA